MKPSCVSYIAVYTSLTGLLIPLTIGAQTPLPMVRERSIANTASSGVSETPTQLPLDLNQCIQLGIQNNYNLRSLALSVTGAQENLAQAKRNLLPALSASASQGVDYSPNGQEGNSHSGSYQVTASVVLFDGAQNWNNIRLNRIKSDQGTQQLVQAQNDLTLQIIDLYLNALKQEELLRYQQGVVNSSEAQFIRGEARWKTGAIFEVEIPLI